ncbi:MAG: HAD-IB family phosphatase [Thermoplasmata archaeon]
MRFDMVAFDMDGVLVAERSSWEWVHRHFGVDNSKSLDAFCSGKIDDMEFMRTDIAMWKSIDPDVSIAQIRGILMKANLVRGARDTVQALKKKGVKTCIVSGGIDLLADYVGELCGVDRVISNGLTADNDGRILGEGILRVELRDKASALSSIIGEFGVESDRCAAVGNSWVDISMFNVSGLGIAFNPIDAQTITAADVVVESDTLTDVLAHLE